MGKGKVEKSVEKGDAVGAQLPEVEVGEAIRTHGRGIFHPADGIGNVFQGERGVGMVDGAFTDFTEKSTGLGILAMGDWAGVLFVEFFSDNFLLSINDRAARGREGDGLVGRLVGLLPGEASEKLPERRRAWVGRCLLHLLRPGVPSGGDGDLLDTSR